MSIFEKFEKDIDAAIHHIIFNELCLDRSKITILAPKYFVEMWIADIQKVIADEFKEANLIKITGAGEEEAHKEIVMTMYKGVKVINGPIATMAFVYHEDAPLRGIQPQIITLGK